jgi:hypothetical protein
VSKSGLENQNIQPCALVILSEMKPAEEVVCHCIHNSDYVSSDDLGFEEKEETNADPSEPQPCPVAVVATDKSGIQGIAATTVHSIEPRLHAQPVKEKESPNPAAAEHVLPCEAVALSQSTEEGTQAKPKKCEGGKTRGSKACTMETRRGAAE